MDCKRGLLSAALLESPAWSGHAFWTAGEIGASSTAEVGWYLEQKKNIAHTSAGLVRSPESVRGAPRVRAPSAEPAFAQRLSASSSSVVRIFSLWNDARTGRSHRAVFSIVPLRRSKHNLCRGGEDSSLTCSRLRSELFILVLGVHAVL